MEESIYPKFVDLRIRLGGEFVTKTHKNRKVVEYQGGWTYLTTGVSVRDMRVSTLRVVAATGFRDAGMDVPQRFKVWYRLKGRTLGSGKREFKDDLDIDKFLETVDKMGILEMYCTVEPVLDPTPFSLPLRLPTYRTKLPTLTISEPQPNQQGPIVAQSQPNLPSAQPTSKPKSPRVKHVAQKGKGKKVRRAKKHDKAEKHKKVKAKRRLFEKDDKESGSSSSEPSDLDVDWNPGEEECELSFDDFFASKGGDGILQEVQSSLAGGLRRDGVPDQGRAEVREEEGDDSEELRSLHGSDSEEEPYTTFNALTDFSKPITLKVGLRFTSSTVARQALRQHAVENRYDFYFLHNDKSRIRTYCKFKCGCPWNPKTCRKPMCSCENQCPFTVYVRFNPRESYWVIYSMRLGHSCVRTTTNKKMNSEYLGDKYIEHWKADPSWKLKAFRQRVLIETGIKITYWTAWLARARAKLKIYGSAAEEYERVWDYAKTITKYNNGSRMGVAVDGLDGPEPPIFMRMYMALNGLLEGFTKGCRPIIGVDGCHLKGAYPGQILVAVGKDGNNNIFPFAWATVEVENTETWVWFLQMLMKDLSGEEGEGWTFMSDRQKGLLEAFNQVVPKAETRYCVRHIWANFKLQFTGTLFKDLFWQAARATTLVDHEIAMESIKFLCEDAYEYLVNIPTRHWCRHAFSTNCKSNMLLNNMCETFNSVIKEARDKPILTQMEWMRRYMMRRCNGKWEEVQKMNGKNMPYITKTLESIQHVARGCIVQLSRDDNYEVEFGGDQVVVDIQARTCTCYHWQLTGIPCIHAYACLMDKRADPNDYVDEAYSRETYLKAYGTPILPVPGAKHWEKMGFRKPLPPAIRVLPGRPKSRKRKKEQGEDQDKAAPLKKTTRCSKCKQLGHNKKTCNNEAAVEVVKQIDKGGRPPSDTPWVKEQRKKREVRALSKVAAGGTQQAASSSQPGSQSVVDHPLQSTQQSQNQPQQQQQTPSRAREKMPFKKGKTKDVGSLYK